MTMIAGGLAGASPHMISATVTAISRLVFEFKGMFIFYPLLSRMKVVILYLPRSNLISHAQRNLYYVASIPLICQPRNCQINFGLHQTRHSHTPCGPHPTPSQGPRSCTFELVSRSQESFQG